MSDILTKHIRLDEVSQTDKKILIKSGRDKYSFWITKQDGSNTKAYQDYVGMNPRVGSTVEIAYKEEDRVFEQNGKSIPYKARTIIAMKESEGAHEQAQMPIAQVQQIMNDHAYVTKQEFDEKIDDIRKTYLLLASQIKELKERQ